MLSGSLRRDGSCFKTVFFVDLHVDWLFINNIRIKAGSDPINWYGGSTVTQNETISKQYSIYAYIINITCTCTITLMYLVYNWHTLKKE